MFFKQINKLNEKDTSKLIEATEEFSDRLIPKLLKFTVKEIKNTPKFKDKSPEEFIVGNVFEKLGKKKTISCN